MLPFKIADSFPRFTVGLLESDKIVTAQQIYHQVNDFKSLDFLLHEFIITYTSLIHDPTINDS